LPKIANFPGYVPPTSIQGIIEAFQEFSDKRLLELAEDLFSIVVLVESIIVFSWLSFLLKLARDLEAIVEFIISKH
jgi:hypothetical protein